MRVQPPEAALRSKSPVESVTVSASELKPLLFVDVELGEDQEDRITVFPGNDPHKLATEFCIRN